MTQLTSILAVIFVLLFVRVSGQCSTSDCGSCISTNGCYWCVDEQGGQCSSDLSTCSGAVYKLAGSCPMVECRSITARQDCFENSFYSPPSFPTEKYSSCRWCRRDPVFGSSSCVFSGSYFGEYERCFPGSLEVYGDTSTTPVPVTIPKPPLTFQENNTCIQTNSIDFYTRMAQYAIAAKDRTVTITNVTIVEQNRQYFLARDDCLKAMVLAIRGSVEAEDFLTDLRGVSNIYADVTDVERGFAHRGFAARAASLEGVIDYLSMPSGFKQIYIVGHSMGASVASLLSFKFQRHYANRGIDLRGYGFAPAPSLTLNIDTSDYFTSFVFRTDFVPRLSLRVLKEAYLSCLDGLVQILIRYQPNLLLKSLNFVFKSLLLFSDPVRLIVPGTINYIPDLDLPFQRAEFTEFETIAVSTTMYSDHELLAYRRAINPAYSFDISADTTVLFECPPQPEISPLRIPVTTIAGLAVRRKRQADSQSVTRQIFPVKGGFALIWDGELYFTNFLGRVSTANNYSAVPIGFASNEVIDVYAVLYANGNLTLFDTTDNSIIVSKSYSSGLSANSRLFMRQSRGTGLSDIYMIDYTNQRLVFINYYDYVPNPSIIQTQVTGWSRRTPAVLFPRGEQTLLSVNINNSRVLDWYYLTSSSSFSYVSVTLDEVDEITDLAIVNLDLENRNLHLQVLDKISKQIYVYEINVEISFSSGSPISIVPTKSLVGSVSLTNINTTLDSMAVSADGTSIYLLSMQSEEVIVAVNDVMIAVNNRINEIAQGVLATLPMPTSPISPSSPSSSTPGVSPKTAQVSSGTKRDQILVLLTSLALLSVVVVA